MAGGMIGTGALFPLSAQEFTPDRFAPPSPYQPWVPVPNKDGDLAAKRRAELGKELSVDLSKPLALADLVDIALRRSPSTREAWFKARSSAAAWGRAKGAYYPRLSVGANAGAEQETRADSTDRPTIEEATGGPSLQMSYLLLDFGGRSQGAEAAKQSLRAANFAFNQSIQDLVVSVEKAYYRYDGSRASIEAAESEVRLAKALRETAELKKQSGLASATDVLQARQNEAEAEFELENIRSQSQILYTDLAQALCLRPNLILPIAAADRQIVSEVTAEIDQLVETALQSRPDVAGAFATLRQKEAEAKQAESNYWPTLSLTGGVGRTYFDSEARTSTSSTQTRGHSNDYQVGLSMSVDLFDGFSGVNQAREARNLAEAERAKWQNTELQAIGEVVEADYAYKSAEKKVTGSRDLLEASQKLDEASAVGYRSGLNSLLERLTAQNKLAEANAAWVNARSDLFLAAVHLSQTTGSVSPSSTDAVLKDGAKSKTSAASSRGADGLR